MSVPPSSSNSCISPGRFTGLCFTLLRFTLLRCTLSLFTLALIGSTWSLWIPQRIYPQVPLLRGATSVPLWIDGWILAILLISLGLAVVTRTGSRLSAATLLTSSLMLVALAALNQHRLQPWAYFFILAALLMAGCPPAQSLRWLRYLVISVYLFSAMGKFDYLFASSIGQDFLGTGMRLFGLSVSNWPPVARQLISLLMPVGELALAVLLAIPGSRRLGTVVGLMLHLTLLLTLGPLGMDQKAAVLIWNVSFGVMLVLLFWWHRSDVEIEADRPRASISNLLARAVVLCALVLPVLEPFDRWDPWLSWGLYSTRAPRVDFYVADHVVTTLPPKLQPYCSDQLYFGYLRKLAIDRWSLDSLGVPIYPHDRFQIGVCAALVDRYGLDQGVVAVRFSPPHRLTGKSETQRWHGAEQIVARLRQFQFNATPRIGFEGPPGDADANISARGISRRIETSTFRN